MACRSPPRIATPPMYADPTYRKPENAVIAKQSVSPQEPALQPLEGKDVQKSKLPDEVKRKLLQEVRL